MRRTCNLLGLPHAAHGRPVQDRLLVRRIAEHLLRQVGSNIPAQKSGIRGGAQPPVMDSTFGEFQLEIID